ncbi:unnamed protein product [Caenorhabditis bovis]|uniref:Uncharacterized protein n=1 Tax=Caenorhabditis bovis TaxID=2654633 RepID=A0A8S1FFR3_9PELO|nr:unnamed protein product [Caenorhabditis bovis]
MEEEDAEDIQNHADSVPGGAAEEGPGKEYEIYIKNEELVDKLKLLNYENNFLKLGSAYKTIHRHYFVKSTNVGEQFFLFTSLAAWLIRISGNENYPMPQEFDDPNSTVTLITNEAKNKVRLEFFIFQFDILLLCEVRNP